jgi:MFS family permease
MNMAMKWKAFATWIVVPFLSAIVVPEAIYRCSSHPEGSPEFRLGILAFILAICIGLATVGTMAVWVMPVKRVWLGIIGGMTAGAGIVALAAWFAMTFYGGFENNIGLFLAAISFGSGSCLAGAYAGFLRSRENQGVHMRRLL